MITRLHFSNFRSHQDTQIQLQPINLLVGPVASGKSNVFRGLVLVQNSVHRELPELFPPGLGEFHWVRSRWAGETDPIGFEVDLTRIPGFPDEQARYAVAIADSPAGLYVVSETLLRQRSGADWEWVFQRHYRRETTGEYGPTAASEPTLLHRVWHKDPRVRLLAEGPRFAQSVARELSSIAYYHLEASALKRLGEGQPVDRIRYTGGRLPDYIASLKSSAHTTAIYETILGEMREVLPGLDAILVTQTATDSQGLAMSFRGHRGYIAAPDFSDGTLFTLGLLCIIHNPNPPAVFCIEEPETGLHPRRLRWLFDRLMGLTHTHEDGLCEVQVILSTHSPYLVDFFGEMPQCVHIVEQHDGRTTIMSLDELQRGKLRQSPVPDEPIGHLWATGLYEGL